jgi:hypothetical protein
LSFARASLSKHLKAEREMLGLVSLVHIAKQRKEDASVAAEPSTVALIPGSKVLIDHLTLASTSAASGARIFSPAKIDTAWPAIGSFFAIAVNSSFTFSEVFAEVSKKRRLASLAYASASATGTARLSGCSATRSALFPARAMTMFSLAWRWSSFTHAFALSSEAYHVMSADGSLCFLICIFLTACVMSYTTTAQFAFL